MTIELALLTLNKEGGFADGSLFRTTQSKELAKSAFAAGPTGRRDCL
jgi:hypothetical protein